MLSVDFYEAICHNSCLISILTSNRLKFGQVRTSTVLSDPNKDISGCISTISLFHALRTVRSFASNQLGPSFRPPRRVVAGVSAVVPMEGSVGTDFKGSGVIPKCISNRAVGRHGKARMDRLREPFVPALTA
jgi:hypothetical protein